MYFAGEKGRRISREWRNGQSRGIKSFDLVETHEKLRGCDIVPAIYRHPTGFYGILSILSENFLQSCFEILADGASDHARPLLLAKKCAQASSWLCSSSSTKYGHGRILCSSVRTCIHTHIRTTKGTLRMIECSRGMAADFITLRTLSPCARGRI